MNIPDRFVIELLCVSIFFCGLVSVLTIIRSYP